jgi:hypothetical protein
MILDDISSVYGGAERVIADWWDVLKAMDQAGQHLDLIQSQSLFSKVFAKAHLNLIDEKLNFASGLHKYKSSTSSQGGSHRPKMSTEKSFSMSADAVTETRGKTISRQFLAANGDVLYESGGDSDEDWHVESDEESNGDNGSAVDDQQDEEEDTSSRFKGKEPIGAKTKLKIKRTSPQQQQASVVKKRRLTMNNRDKILAICNKNTRR